MTQLEANTSDDGDYDSVSALIRYEAGELDEIETVRLFQHLVNTGLAWKLQKHFGRRARALLGAGQIRQTNDGVRAVRPLNKARFSLGQTVITANAIDLLHPDEIALGLARHVRGDWGDVDHEDAQSNDDALIKGRRLLSAYGAGDRRFWIITEWDRSVTTILLPQDY